MPFSTWISGPLLLGATRVADLWAASRWVRLRPVMNRYLVPASLLGTAVGGAVLLR